MQERKCLFKRAFKNAETQLPPCFYALGQYLIWLNLRAAGSQTSLRLKNFSIISTLIPLIYDCVTSTDAAISLLRAASSAQSYESCHRKPQKDPLEPIIASSVFSYFWSFFDIVVWMACFRSSFMSVLVTNQRAPVMQAALDFTRDEQRIRATTHVSCLLLL